MKKLIPILLIFALLLSGCSVPDSAVTDPSTGETSTSEPVAEPDTMTVHFIDVGQADCALLECNGEYIIIDGGNVADSSLVVSYLEQQGVEELEAVICTHAHEDHVGGLAGVLAVYPTDAVYAPTSTYSSNCFDSFMYYTDQQGLSVTIPAPGDAIEFGGATATVLGPVDTYSETNNTSIVLMVQFGDTRFLFTGDMETSAENDMLDYWGDGFDWSADVLKVGHHGSDTSTGYRFLNAVMPTYGVISVGANNSYGHPCEEPLSKLRDAGVIVYRTDELGHIIATSDGETVSFTWGDQSAQPVIPETDPTEDTGSVETTQPSEPAGNTQLTIAEALQICAQTGSAETTEKYYIRGTVTKVSNTTYGNMTIEDGTGSIYIYGCYSADGSTRYDAMAEQPQVGDEVLLWGTLVTYSGSYGDTPEMMNAWVIELIAGQQETTAPTQTPDPTEETKDTDDSGTAEHSYIGNKNSKKFHLPTCGSLPAEKNQVYFETYDEAVAAGYTPCSKCLG